MELQGESFLLRPHIIPIWQVSPLHNWKFFVNAFPDGSTIMHIAVHSGNHIALEMLLQYGANTNIQDSQGRAPLHWAAVIPGTQCLEVCVYPKSNLYSIFLKNLQI